MPNFLRKEKNEDKALFTIPENLIIYAGNTAKLLSIPNKDDSIKILSIESINKKVADVVGNHVIAYHVGSTKILTTVDLSNEIVTYATEITVKAGEVSITPEVSTIQVGEAVKIRTIVSCGVFKSLTYESDNLSVATVTQDGIFGIIRGISKGEVTITVTINIGNVIKVETLSIEVKAAEPEILPISNPVSGEKYTEEDEWKGSRVYFGVFEQDNNIKNGKEPILWRVLEITDDTILLLSEYGLINKFYHDTFENVTWETSSIRRWLNTTFLDHAFTKIELNAIDDTLLKNSDNKDYGSSGGNHTIDKAFLLTRKDVNNTAYGFIKGSRKKSLTRTLKSTEYALELGYASKENGNTCWWLRNPGISNQYASYVFTKGSITDTYFVGRRNDAVRPAIRVKRSAILFGDGINDGKHEYPRLIAKDY